MVARELSYEIVSVSLSWVLTGVRGPLTGYYPLARWKVRSPNTQIDRLTG